MGTEETVQNSSDRYGMKGLSWDGTDVTYRSCSTEDNGDRVEENTLVKHIYYEHLCQNSSEKDARAVLSIAELVCMRITRDLKTVRRVVFRSDNAPNYKKSLLHQQLRLYPRIMEYG